MIKPLGIFTLALFVVSITGAVPSLAHHAKPTSTSSVSLSDGSSQPIPDLTMPKTIKVLRTATGKIETVDFNYYVKNVMPNEWGMPGWPTETLKAGAMAVKMYGWMHVTTYHKYPGLGYDVKDSTADQVYKPESAEAYTNAAVDATWDYVMTRNGKLFEPEYDSGIKGSLNSLFPNRLGQEGAVILANQGKTWQQIIHYYYDPMGVINITKY
jgi:peptidoglycan hydrolase-like amidase